MRFQPAGLRITFRAHRPPHREQTFRRLRAEIVRQLGSLPVPALPIALRFLPPNIVSCRLIRSFGLLVPPTAINPDFVQSLWTRWTWWTSGQVHSCPQSPFLSTQSMRVSVHRVTSYPCQRTQRRSRPPPSSFPLQTKRHRLLHPWLRPLAVRWAEPFCTSLQPICAKPA